MTIASAEAEFRREWLPRVSDAGLARLTSLLEAASPLLLHGAFARVPPMGCLATQIAWHHPATRHCADEAGVRWLTKVAGLNPATSLVVNRWDAAGVHDFEFRQALVAACRAELANRAAPARRSRRLAGVGRP